MQEEQIESVWFYSNKKDEERENVIKLEKKL